MSVVIVCLPNAPKVSEEAVRKDTELNSYLESRVEGESGWMEKSNVYVLIVFVWMNSTHKIGHWGGKWAAGDLLITFLYKFFPHIYTSYFYWKCASYLYIPLIDLATCYCLTSSQICSGSQQKNDTIMTSFSTSASISPLYSLSAPLLLSFTQTFTILLEWISFSFPVLFAHFFFLISTHIFFLCLWEHKTLWTQSSLSG